MKKYLLIIVSVLLCYETFAQMEVSTVKESRDPWKFGINVNATYDWVNQPKYIEKQYGAKVGVAGEKHLVYNLYFKPTFNFWKKGYKSVFPQGSVDVEGYFLDFEATLELKFGDERLGRGFIFSLTPFFTYGIFGNTTWTNNDATDAENYTAGVSKTVKTFADGNLHKEDVGYMFGIGYDFNHHWELDAKYIMGFVNIGRWNNYRWRGFSIGVTYFFQSDKKRY